MLLVASFVVFSMSGIMWYREVYLSKDRVFWGAIENALRVNGVRRTADYSTESATQTLTVHAGYSPTLTARGLSTYIDEPKGVETVNESYATRTSEYARFVTVTDPQTPELKAIEGVWADTLAVDAKESKTIADQLTNTTIILTGQFGDERGQDLVELMKTKKLYEPIAVVRQASYSGKTVDIYQVRMNIDAYNSVLSTYLGMLGLPNASNEVDTASTGEEPIIIEVAIDPRTRTIYGAGYPSVESVGAETYDLWGVAPPFDPPTEILSQVQLEERLREVYGEE